MQSHPGGRNLILQYAGRDASKAFEEVHTADTLANNLSKDSFLGVVEEDLLRINVPAVNTEKKKLPPLSRVLSLIDMEVGKLISYLTAYLITIIRKWHVTPYRLKRLRFGPRARTEK
jgi:L-lactate dehydrogenase (cytochrome)